MQTPFHMVAIWSFLNQSVLLTPTQYSRILYTQFLFFLLDFSNGKKIQFEEKNLQFMSLMRVCAFEKKGKRKLFEHRFFFVKSNKKFKTIKMKEKKRMRSLIHSIVKYTKQTKIHFIFGIRINSLKFYINNFQMNFDSLSWNLH